MRCNCGMIVDGIRVRNHHLSTCGIYDDCVWCESSMGEQLGDVHERCKPLIRQAIMSLQRWAEKATK